MRLIFLFPLSSAAAIFAQPCTLHSQVADESGAIVPHANVTITVGATSSPITATADRNGAYTFNGLYPGTYSISAMAPALATASPVSIVLAAGAQLTLNLVLKVAATQQQMTVNDDGAPPPIGRLCLRLSTLRPR